MALGALIFGADRLLSSFSSDPGAQEAREEREPIEIDARFRAGLAAQHRSRAGREPTEEELEGLLARFLEEEVLYREARRAGLDAGDVILRRRLAQKMRFLIESEVELPEPSDEELEGLLQTPLRAHPEEQLRPAQISLRQVFFAQERRGERAEAEAAAALEALLRDPDRERPEDLGDPFLGGHSFTATRPTRLDGVFGPGFAEALSSLSLGRWGGPIRSRYGLHLVRVEAREEARPRTLEEARPQLLRRWQREQRERAVRAEIRRLIALYRPPGGESD